VAGGIRVYVDFHALADDDSVVREITQQLTAAENRPSEPADQKASNSELILLFEVFA
jgi:hypothetical protein